MPSCPKMPLTSQPSSFMVKDPLMETKTDRLHKLPINNFYATFFKHYKRNKKNIRCKKTSSTFLTFNKIINALNNRTQYAHFVYNARSALPRRLAGHSMYSLQRQNFIGQRIA
jgi:hypothetical protein